MSDSDDIARRQQLLGLFNRRTARNAENLSQALSVLIGVEMPVGLICACGRPDCAETVSVTIAEYERVRESPHRYLVAPGHATDLDDVVFTGIGYEIVAVRPEFRPLRLAERAP